MTIYLPLILYVMEFQAPKYGKSIYMKNLILQ